MLEYLRGDVARVGGDAAIIEIGGVGLRVQMPTGDLAGLRGTVTVHTVLHVREDDMQIFGFTTERARELFRTLTTVSKVGPKLALAILSFHSPASLERAIVSGDFAAIALVSGVGPKTAQRIVLELRDKLGLQPEQVVTGPLSDVRDALQELGYSSSEVTEVLRDLPADGDAETLMRMALRALDRREPTARLRAADGV